jgi:uncharacterized membrane protein
MGIIESSRVNTKTLVLVALFIALSYVGSYIKIFGSIAFDSFPGFLAALLLGPIYGAAIGFLGHLFTALTSGFPLSLPLHMVIAASMAITMLVFGYTYKALSKKASTAGTLIFTGITGVVLNGPVSLAFSIIAMSFMAGIEAALGLLALLPFLTIAAVVNVVISITVYKSLGGIWSKIV